MAKHHNKQFIHTDYTCYMCGHATRLRLVKHRPNKNGRCAYNNITCPRCGVTYTFNIWHDGSISRHLESRIQYRPMINV